MDVFYVCIVMRGAVGARAWKLSVFRHADVVFLCLVCILWQFSLLFCMTCSLLMLVEDARPYGRGILQSRSHNCLVGSHECLFLFTPSCCSKCFYEYG